MAELRRTLGLWPTAAVVVGTVIGSGIFLVPSDMVNAVGSPGMVFSVWIFGGILSLFGVLTYAELAAAMPGAGGEYVYLTAAYGPFWGFVYGWTQTWVAKTASIATLATGFYTYTADFFPQLKLIFWNSGLPWGANGMDLGVSYGQLIGILVILFLSGVNSWGVRLGGNVQVVLTGIKIGLILAVIVFALSSSNGLVTNFGTETQPTPGGIPGFFAALVAALWAYDGWNNAAMIGSEVKNAERNLPRALIFGTAGVIALYLLTNAAYFYVLNAGEVGVSQRVAADVMRRVLGPRGGEFVSIAAMISIFAALNGSILSGSRVPFAMARNGYFFSSLGMLHPKRLTPANSILLLGVWSCVLLLSGQYRQLYTLVIFPSWILYAMTAASVPVLRWRKPELARPYKTMGYPIVPLAFVLVSGMLLYSTLQTSPRESLIGLVLIVIGLPFYFYWRSSGRGTS